MKQILQVIIAGLTLMTGCLSSFANDDKDDPSKTTAKPTAKAKNYSKYRAFMSGQNQVSKQILTSVEHQIESLEHLNYNVPFAVPSESPECISQSMAKGFL